MAQDGVIDFDKLREEAGRAMNSVLWEYCPKYEFFALLDEVARFRERERDLIRYNSEQVVARRVSDARLRVALAALQTARDTFTEYGKLHRAKNTLDGSLKALRNDQLASHMDDAMTFDPDPADYGRP